MQAFRINLLTALILIFCETIYADDSCRQIDKYRGAVNLTASKKNVTLSKDAVSKFALEACSLNSFENRPIYLNPDTQIEKWFSSSAPNQEINFLQARSIIADWKEIVLEKELPKIFENGVKQSTGLYNAEKLIKADTIKRARRMAKTDSSLNEIFSYSIQYKTLAESNASSEASYKAFQNSLERVIVNVKFLSNPAQASVELKPNGISLGSTEFTKGLDSERSYTFLIKKEGYRDQETTRYIPATPKDQSIEINLEKTEEQDKLSRPSQ